MFNSGPDEKAMLMWSPRSVSNFSIKLLDQLATTSTVIPSVNQVESHPYHPQVELFAYCKSKGIHLTAYCRSSSPSRLNSNLTR